MLAALSGCQKEEVAPTGIELNPISRLEAEKLIKEWNSQRKSKLKSATTLSISETLWQKAKVYLNEEEEMSTISLPFYKKFSICFGKRGKHAELYFCETRPDLQSPKDSDGGLIEEQFSGYLIIYGSSYKPLVAYRFENGSFASEFDVVSRKGLLKSGNDDVAWEMQIEEAVITYKRKPENHEYVYIPRYSMADYVGKVMMRFDSDSELCGGSPTNPDPKPEVNTTDSSFINTKADCVFKKLVGATATTVFDPNTVTGNLLKDFFNDKYSVKFKIVSASQMGNKFTANAETYPPTSNNEIEVWLKDTYVNSSSMVEIARTLIHESIHAQIFMAVKYPNEAYSSDANFADLWKRYQELGKQAQHNVMAESSYIAIIAKGVEEYHKNNRSVFEANLKERRLLEGFNYSEFYSNLAWYGLHKTEAFIQKNNNQDWSSKFNESLKQALNNDTFECK